MEMNEKKNHKILIVDDQQKNIQVLGSLLRQKNYIIGVATNGEEALEALSESNDYDLVLLDVNMPVMNGFEACKAIRRQKNLREIPIIFLTAMIETESILTGFEIGGQDYVTKPFNSKELLARVSTHLELKHSKDQLKQVNNWLEKKVAERTEELKVANDKLLQLDSAKSEFLNIISHEIRTPLNGIVGVLGILNDIQVPEEINNLLNILEISANRLEEFSYKALDISLFNTRKQDALNLNLADLNEIVTSNVIEFKKNAEKKNISIIQQNEANDTFIILDKTFINKCFSYIIDNAVKFANKDSLVVIKIASSEENLIVTIKDEGKPLPEDYNIFNIRPFNTKTHIDQNPALSLFLCKQIIEAHNGYIEIINLKNGVLTTITLPKKR